jgi:farnesyl-diphosphate farnesyltransferase
VGKAGDRERAAAAEAFAALGRRFGQGLQLVNILRDLPKDLRLGRCYLPANRLQAIGLEPAGLLNPAEEPRLRPLYNSLLNQAEAHLAAGWDYTNQLPVSCPRLRLACAWPVLLGVRTLALLRTRNPLDPGRRIKVSRRAVRALLLRSLVFYPAPPLWRQLWMEASGGSRRG